MELENVVCEVMLAGATIIVVVGSIIALVEIIL